MYLGRVSCVFQVDWSALLRRWGWVWTPEGWEYVQGVDDTWDVTEDSQQNVDEEVSAAATLEEDTEWWEDDSENDLADISEGVLAVFLRWS